MYGIRSNISDPTICSAKYDTLVSVFKAYCKQDVLNIVFDNPCFFKMRKELLSRAHFNIVDLDSKQSNQEASIGTPTYIHTIVKEVPIQNEKTIYNLFRFCMHNIQKFISKKYKY